MLFCVMNKLNLCCVVGDMCCMILWLFLICLWMMIIYVMKVVIFVGISVVSMRFYDDFVRMRVRIGRNVSLMIFDGLLR